MGERELLLVLLSLGLFSATLLSINQFMILNSDENLQDDFKHEAVMLGQRIIEEAKARRFDDNITIGPFPENFQDPLALQAETGEVYPNFNDLDDFGNGHDGEEFRPYEFEIETQRGTYSLETKVSYVQENNLELDVLQKQLYKKLSVTIKSDYLKRDITLNHVFGFINPGL